MIIIAIDPTLKEDALENWRKLVGHLADWKDVFFLLVWFWFGCLLAWLFACLFVCLVACLFACLVVCLLGCLLAWSFGCFVACLLAWFACLGACLVGWFSFFVYGLLCLVFVCLVLLVLFGGVDDDDIMLMSLSLSSSMLFFFQMVFVWQGLGYRSHLVFDWYGGQKSRAKETVSWCHSYSFTFWVKTSCRNQIIHKWICRQTSHIFFCTTTPL